MKGDGIDEAALDAYVKRVLAQAPPLTDEQRTRLAELLRPVQTCAIPREMDAVS
jgi:hypothetical protein